MGNECSQCTTVCNNADIQVDNTYQYDKIYLRKSEEPQQLLQKPLISVQQFQESTHPQETVQNIAEPEQQSQLNQSQELQNFDSHTDPNKYFTYNDQKETMNQQIGDPNVIERRPPFTFKSGAIYDGEWKGTNREGFGLQIWPDGARYEGEWVDNKACGKGKFWHVDGDIYDGEWREDKANGFGVYTHINGARYEGNWKDDLQDGHGVETWVDGSSYEGVYFEGKKHGQGTYIWSDGSKYVGQWTDNKISGTGIYTWLDGRRYEGEWLDNNMHGKGVYSWKDGRRYEGEYQFDKKHGYGTYQWADGRIYEGQWAYGKQHGRGKYYFDGNARVGLWEEGKRLKWIDGSSDENQPASQHNILPTISQRSQQIFDKSYQFK